MRYLIFATKVEATNFAREAGIRSGLGPESLYPFARIENPQTGEWACEITDNETHRLTADELAGAIDEVDMDDIWFSVEEVTF